MKKLFITFSVTLSLGVTFLLSDSLSNSLNGMLHQKKSSLPGMVNLNGIGLGSKPKRKRVVKHVFKGRSGKTVIGHYDDGKDVHKSEADKYVRKVTKGKIKDLDMLPKKQRLLVLSDLQKIYAAKHFKRRPSDTIIATVNGVEMQKKEADVFLTNVTKGKIKDFDRLDEKQRFAVIQDIARPIILKNAIKTDITEEERNDLFKQLWLEKERQKIEVTSEEMLSLYENKKAQTLAVNPQAQIPTYISLGAQLKKEIVEQKIMKKIMKDVNITISYDSNETSEKLDKIPFTKDVK